MSHNVKRHLLTHCEHHVPKDVCGVCQTIRTVSAMKDRIAELEREREEYMRAAREAAKRSDVTALLERLDALVPDARWSVAVNGHQGAAVFWRLPGGEPVEILDGSLTAALITAIAMLEST